MTTSTAETGSTGQILSSPATSVSHPDWIDIRYLKVTAAPGRASSVSALRIEGRWLERAGFAIGSRVLVRVAPGRLEIELEPPVATLT